ncbi:hypothetical protein CHS0354_038574 [Potamilus streckersoni]|uniref:Tyrosinase copper-binding domain-containing protein n=1 Tax=Potamilus streckersoni TaxID=2493646 RepID=A0AAE0VIU4_9BIVA|nr:hypothetical protein CHS0354_038574 [Potamilus streckersoni]
MVFWECMQQVMWRMAEQLGTNDSSGTQEFLDKLLRITFNPEANEIPRHRTEYRMLTESERQHFHAAINALKADNSLKPSVYAAFAQLHAGQHIPLAHFGPNFPGWHRIFILLFETALRLKNPTVSIPYWASHLDSSLPDPTKSIIWSEEFLGNGDGFVTTGPFKNFVTANGTILRRNTGVTGHLFTQAVVDKITSSNSTSDITEPNGPFETNIELQHNQVHHWINGNMDNLNTAAEDPVFYLLHSYVDHIWEEFRKNLKKIGIDPDLDYPLDYGPEEQAPDAPIGFGGLHNNDGLNSVFSELVTYAPFPTCTSWNPDCGSPFLKCDLTESVPKCVSITVDEYEMLLRKTEHDPCAMPTARIMSVQNNFAINTLCDIRQWAFIPVKIVSKRPPEFGNYKSFPVLNNQPYRQVDVFSPEVYFQKSQRSQTGIAHCPKTNEPSNRIMIESHGLNYYGSYKDYVLLDQRHAITTAVTYIGIRAPNGSSSDVIFSAYDRCGRICKPFCLDIKSNVSKPKPCQGVIRVSNLLPMLYGRTYAEAVKLTWKKEDDSDLPELDDSVFLTFYCNHESIWPWERTVRRQLGESQTGNVGNILTQIARRNPPQSRGVQVFPPRATLPVSTRRLIIKCRVNPSCTIVGACRPCTPGTRQRCEGPRNMFAVCINGVYSSQETVPRI